MTKSKIRIRNHSEKVVVIDIEGVIGVDELSQFEQPADKVATYEKFKTQAEKIGRIASPEVIVNIRSAGGNVNDALLIFDALRQTNARVTTKCFGYVASAATIIAQAASEGRRLVSANSLYLVHNSTSNCDGNCQQMNQTIELLKATDTTIANLYAQRAAKEKEMFVELMSENNGNGRWMTPDEVVEYGLADQVMDSAEGRRRVSASIVSQLGLPPLPEDTIPMSIGEKLRMMWEQFLDSIEEIVAPEQTIEQTIATEPSLPENVAPAPLTEITLIHTASPTTTQQCEDPSPEENKQRPNEAAYGEDVKRFK